MASISSILNSIDNVLPKLGALSFASARRLIPCASNKQIWQAILLGSELANELTRRKSKVAKAAMAISAACTGYSIINSKISQSQTGHYHEWSEVSHLSGIATPQKISCIKVGPVPPRVIAAIINTIRVGDEVKFHHDYTSDSPIYLVYTSITGCARHGTTYAITTGAGTDVPYIVLKSKSSYFVFRIPTIDVRGTILMDVTKDMLVKEGTDCSVVTKLITHGVITTFCPSKYYLYPSEDTATLTDTNPRREMDLSVTHSAFPELSDEIRKALYMGVTRSYMLYGEPGTGKTTLALQLAWAVKDVPLVVLPAARILAVDYPLDNMYNYLSSLLELHTRAIFIMDDIDGCEIENKTLATTRLINFMDRLNECSKETHSSYIMLVTANDLANISETIVGRSGRIDDLINVTYPSEEMIAAAYGIYHKNAARCMANHKFTMADVQNVKNVLSINGKLLQCSPQDIQNIINRIIIMKKKAAYAHGHQLISDADVIKNS